MPDLFSVGGRAVVDVGDELPSQRALFGRELAISEEARAANVRVRVGNHGHSPREVFGTTGAIAHSGAFLCPDGKGHYCSFDPTELAITSDLHVELSVCCPNFSSSVLLEWLVIPICQHVLAAHSIAPLHASGVVLDEPFGGVVFSAWAGVGKTNMLLYALFNQGAGYLGDDLVLVNEQGEAIPSKRSISAFGYNRAFLPDRFGKGLRMRFGERIRRFAVRKKSLFGPLGDAAVYLGNALSNVRVPVDSATGGSSRKPVPIIAHVRCISEFGTSASELGDGHQTPVEFAQAHVAVMDYEYVQFQRYLKTYAWAKSIDSHQWNVLRSAWQPILESYFKKIPRSFELHIPQVEDARLFVPQAWERLLGCLKQ